MCPSVATDLDTGKRANTGCLGGRIMCPSVTTDLHLFLLCVDQLLHPDTLSYLLDNQSFLFLLCRSVATLGHIILPPRQPVVALFPVCRSVATLEHIILPPR
jgi:hypothetical protein